MESFAFGQVGLSPDLFYDLTPREWTNLVDGYNKKEQRSYQNEWERTRWMTARLLNVHTKKTIHESDLILFPWDKEKKKNRRVFSKAEVIAAVNKRNEIALLRKNGQPLKSQLPAHS